jgi:trehalose synthase
MISMANRFKEEQGLLRLDDFSEFVSQETLDRIRRKAAPLQEKHITHINSTYYGGGVAELLSSLSLLMNSVGIRTGWRVIQGAPDFFSVTKKMHNALQGADINLSERKKEIYHHVTVQNAVRNHLDHDVVYVHDPQPLGMIDYYEKKGPWIWRCHVDLSHPDPELWNFLKPWVEKYDAVITSLPEYKLDLKTPQRFIMPAIDPTSIKNRKLSKEEIDERFEYYDIPRDLPLVVQISRFDRWKDPRGVIEAFKLASKRIDARLILLGNVATDDPEGEKVYQELLEFSDDRIRIMSREDTALVNALQCEAAVVLQKSIREGFGLTVTEAMWKSTPVIGGNVGGIRHQIVDGETGYLVDSVEQAADRIVDLIDHPDRARAMGAAGRERVRDNFLLTRLLEQHLDLLLGFETIYRLKGSAS